MIDIASIESKLRKIGVIIDKSSLKLYGEQGKVNEVYSIDSNEGKLIIHVGRHSDKNVQEEKSERIYGLSQFLSEYPTIPKAKVLAYGKDSSGNSFIVQELIEGVRFSSIENKLELLKELGRILARLHQIDVSQGGHIEFKTGQIRGKHKDWLSFLMKESYNCLNQIYLKRKNIDLSKERYAELEHKLDKFFSEYEQYFVGIRGKLIHGDLILDNIIVHEEHIVALIDLEWSCSGDPAWEFALPKSLDEVCLRAYFEELKKLGLNVDEYSFRFKIKLYRIIKMLFIANTLTQNEAGTYCFNEFEKTLTQAL